jgi:hypothetical protein
VAQQTKNILNLKGLINQSQNRLTRKFYTTGKKNVMAKLMNWDESIIEDLG